MTSENNTTRSNIKNDEAVSVINGIIRWQIKGESVFFAALKYLHGQYETNWPFMKLKQYIVAASDQADKNNAWKLRDEWLSQSDEYNKMRKELAVLDAKKKENSDVSSFKEEYGQVKKRLDAIHTRTHEAFIAAFGLAYLKSKHKSSIITFNDKSKRVLVANVTDKDGNPAMFDMPGNKAISRGKEYIKEILPKAPQSAGNTAANQAAETALVTKIEEVINALDGYIKNKKNPLDNAIVGAEFGGLFAKLLHAVTINSDNGSLRPVEAVTNKDFITDLMKGYAANTKRNEEEEKKKSA